MCEKGLCSNCGINERKKYSRFCCACANYQWKHGVPRPIELSLRVQERKKKPKWCKNCGDKVDSYQRCNACRLYWARHKKERPKWMWDSMVRCATCGFPKSALKPYKNGCVKFYGDRCNACRMYRVRFGKERPQRLWGAGKHGFCECGKPANHSIDKFPLCDECAVEYKKGAFS